MNRRHWLRATSAAGIALLTSRWGIAEDRALALSELFPGLADAALDRAKALGASFADVHFMQTDEESIFVRETMVQGIDAQSSAGCSVRVLVDGCWGFAASAVINREEILRLTEQAAILAKGQTGWRLRRLEIETLPAHTGKWEMPLEIDPFTISLEDKTADLLTITQTALGKGANFCDAHLFQVRERKWLANSFGTRVQQSRVRLQPAFSVTVLDPKKGGFASRASLLPPRAAGYEHMQNWDAAAESALAVEQARQKLTAPSVTPGKLDLVIAPSNLWLTIHETVGHPTELDRALGYEANFAGTSFCTPDKLDRLRYGSELVTIMGDRTAPGGLASVAWDDDGTATAGKEFPIIERGIFRNFQMALGQAALIGRKESNGCAYADSFDSFPIQRMPNISLQPGPDPAATAASLISGVEDGIYIEGNGSWSIDQQRYNFQFTGQVFHRIRNGKLDGMLRDVAYQGNSVDFWNACDGLGGAATYELGGAFNCGKGQPGQIAAVSHGAVPARFRKINVLNTATESGQKTACFPTHSRDCCCGEARTSWT
jgi:TldD protein